ncbi:hypothetical protein CEE44_01765 [Candidatus Woesearchaeota archaeon B3_Woes]|nr:MAG: hypothetical protein CEE44_01765 [Candidatus Woesearchaeota archaeon B3_Woes]
MTKVLLVQPVEYRRYYNSNPDYKRYFSRELGLLQLASFLEQNNVECKLIPGHYKKEDFYKILKKEVKKYNIIATTCLTPEYNIACDILKFAKQINQNIKTVIGGHHVTWLDKEVLKNSFIDIVVKGEGEQTFLDIVNNKKDIKGISYKKNNQIKTTENQKSLHIIPKLNNNILKEYNKTIKKSDIKFFQFNYTSTRGCPYNCSFCTEPLYWGNRVRYKDINHVREEIDTILDNKKCKRIFFMDSNFTINQKYVKQFCKEIKSNTSFKCYTKINYYPKEIANLLKKAGFDVVHFGVEHFNKDIQKSINKVNSLSDIKKTLKNAKEGNQKTGIYIVVGLPGDNVERAKYNYKLTQELVKENLLDEVIPFIFIPYPGTDQFKNPNKYKLNILTKDFSKYSRTHQPIISYKNFTNDEIELMFRLFTDYAYELSLKNPHTSMFSEP